MVVVQAGGSSSLKSAALFDHMAKALRDEGPALANKVTTTTRHDAAAQAATHAQNIRVKPQPHDEARRRRQATGVTAVVLGDGHQVKGSYRFVVSGGGEEGVWYLDLKAGGKGDIRQGDKVGREGGRSGSGGEEEAGAEDDGAIDGYWVVVVVVWVQDSGADVTIVVGDDDFVQIVTGKLNSQQAFMKGKLKVGRAGRQTDHSSSSTSWLTSGRGGKRLCPG